MISELEGQNNHPSIEPHILKRPPDFCTAHVCSRSILLFPLARLRKRRHTPVSGVYRQCLQAFGEQIATAVCLGKVETSEVPQSPVYLLTINHANKTLSSWGGQTHLHPVQGVPFYVLYRNLTHVDSFICQERREWEKIKTKLTLQPFIP